MPKTRDDSSQPTNDPHLDSPQHANRDPGGAADHGGAANGHGANGHGASNHGTNGDATLGRSLRGHAVHAATVAPDPIAAHAVMSRIDAPPASSVRGATFPVMVLSHLRWDFVWQRPQQVFSRLAASGHPVLFVEDPVTEDGPARLSITEPHPGVHRVVPLLPRDHATSVDAQCATILPLLRDALARHPRLAGRFASPVLWFYSPMTAPCYLGRFEARAVVYDCMDELANFRFAPPDIGIRERFLLSRADVVFAGGHELTQAKARHHANVHFFGCGVDVEHFGKARLPQTPIPPEVAGLPRPIVGYFGVIDERIDYALLGRLADELADASVVMVGPLAKVERDALPVRPNIHWLGQRAYRDLPALVKSFDVCLMPFALNEATRYINPTKTLEYMAAGKPIVSTAVPDVVRNFTPIVEIAPDHDGFVDAVAQACRAPCVELLDRGLERAQRASWDATVAAMRARVLEAMPTRAVAPGSVRRVDPTLSGVVSIAAIDRSALGTAR